MPIIIKDKAITDSEFQVADETVDISTSNVLLPLATYLANKEALVGRNDIGIWLEAGENVEDIEQLANSVPIIGLNFPSFGDGRAYSSANILRRKFNYQGELRAIGDVRRDQLEQMQRCGFNSFQMADGQDVEKSLAGLEGFSYNYQTSIDRPDPLFQKR